MENKSKKAIVEFLRFSRAYTANLLPWFSPALFRCNIILTEQVPVAAIDSRLNVYFNPLVITNIQQEYPQNSALAQVGFIWVHEISHILREHAQRARDLGVEPGLWNIAADLEINDARWKGLEIPRDYPAVMPRQFGMPNGLLAEQYLPQLRSKTNSTAIIMHTWDDGSGAHGKARLWEVSQNVNENTSIEELRLNVLRQQVADKMKQLGKHPGSWKRWVEEILQPKVDWRKVLRHRLKMALNISNGRKIDYSYQKMHRRQTFFQPIILPSLIGDMQAEIAVVVDTSGSIGKRMLAQTITEVISLLETFRLPIRVIPCDAKAYAALKINHSSDYFKLTEMTGGGGTNMNQGIEAALALKPRPDVIIVLTDGHTPWPEAIPVVPTFWGILYPQGGNIPLPPMPPWTRDQVIGIELTK